MHRVVITGMGWVTPMGHAIDAVWKRLLNGESGIARTTIFDASTFPTTFSAEVKDYRLEDFIPNASDHPAAASTQAIGEAAETLRRGDADVMIGGGAHSMIHPFGVTGFNRLTALSADEHLKNAIGTTDVARASRPFDAQRGGFVLGEG